MTVFFVGIKKYSSFSKFKLTKKLLFDFSYAIKKHRQVVKTQDGVFVTQDHFAENFSILEKNSSALSV